MKFRLSTIDPDTAAEQSDVRTLAVTREGSGLRIVFDEDGSGSEHDVLIEHWPNGWSVLLHAYGEDPVLALELLPDRVEIRDEMGGVLKSISISAPRKPTRSS